jgi:D-alanyl-D-alanine carboxypeptidase
MNSGAGFATTLTNPVSIAELLAQVSESKTLANPAIILIDKKTGEVVYQRDEVSPRKPASIIKILSTAVALEYLQPTHKFVTRTYLSKTPRTILLEGSYDPWMTTSSVVAKKDHRAWIPYLESKSMQAINLAEGRTTKSVVIKYSHVYAGDISSLTKYFRLKGVSPKFVEINATDLTKSAGNLVASVSSPSVADMVKFALTWSDNLLAERLARAGAHAAGFSMSDIGVSDAVVELLSLLEIDTSGLYVGDGSGLSKEDRVTASLMGQLLLKIRMNPKFISMYEGFPVAGLTGTLEDRYFSTAPEAIGLVHAKTGTLDGTVSLAGYVDAGDREYVFVVIADRIRKGSVATNQARSTIDHLLGKIASPLTVAR